MANRDDITQLLEAYGQGTPGAFDRLLPLIYDDLRRIARQQLRRSGFAQTLDTTGLVHEAYLKLAGQARLSASDRSHFFAISARAMRQVLIAFARRRQAEKRGGGERPITLDEGRIALDEQFSELLLLDQALERLGARDAQLSQVVECRFFAGLSESETAEAMGISLRTAQRTWMRARAWLKEELEPGTDAAP